MALADDLCKVFDHEWPWTGSGEASRPKCKRCKLDYIEWWSDRLVKAAVLLRERGIKLNEKDIRHTLQADKQGKDPAVDDLS